MGMPSVDGVRYQWQWELDVDCNRHCIGILWSKTIISPTLFEVEYVLYLWKWSTCSASGQTHVSKAPSGRCPSGEQPPLRFSFEGLVVLPFPSTGTAQQPHVHSLGLTLTSPPSNQVRIEDPSSFLLGIRAATYKAQVLFSNAGEKKCIILFLRIKVSVWSQEASGYQRANPITSKGLMVD